MNHYNATKSKATNLHNPVFRVFHRFLAHTIFGRGDGENNFSKKEVVVFWALLKHKSLNFAGFMINHLKSVGNRGSGGIVVGGLVIRFARYFGIPLDGRVVDIESSSIGFALFQKMNFIYRHHNSCYMVIPTSDCLLRLLNPKHTSILIQANWRLEARFDDPRSSELKHSRDQEEEVGVEEEEEHDDEENDADYVLEDDEVQAGGSGQNWYAMMEVMQKFQLEEQQACLDYQREMRGELASLRCHIDGRFDELSRQFGE